VVVNSGARPLNKGDARMGEALLVECKTTMTPQVSVTVKKAHLDEIRKQAFQMRCDLAALVLDFGAPPEYFVVNQSDFYDLYQAWLQVRQGVSDGAD